MLVRYILMIFICSFVLVSCGSRDKNPDPKEPGTEIEKGTDSVDVEDEDQEESEEEEESENEEDEDEEDQSEEEDGDDEVDSEAPVIIPNLKLPKESETETSQKDTPSTSPETDNAKSSPAEKEEGYDESWEEKFASWITGASDLHMAVGDKNLKEVRRLIEQGHDVNETDRLDRTPLHRSVESGQLAIAQVLIVAGAHVDSKDGGPYNSGLTPLHHAVLNHRLDFVRLFVNNGATLDMYNDSKETPLYLSVEKGYYEIVRFLVNQGADFNLKNDDGKTIFELAKEKARESGVNNQIYSFLKEKVDSEDDEDSEYEEHFNQGS